MRLAGLFSGVGGIELGFEKAGFDIVWSNEIDDKAVETLKENFDHPIVHEDIHGIKGDQIPDVDVIAGGFPCQAFSVAGYQKGFEDERGEIFFQMARIIKKKMPRVIFIENVRNLMSHDKGNTYRVIKETLNSYGYRLKTMILNSTEYANIPQNRERVFIIGFKFEQDFYHFNLIEKMPLDLTIRDIIDYDSKVDEKYYYTPEKNNFYDELEKSMKNEDTVYQWRRTYVRKNKSNVCPTLTANMGTGGHNVPLVLTKKGIRKLTPKECFLFQGFPESFRLPEMADCHLYKQAGNSVVVPLIERLATEVKKAILKTNAKYSEEELIRNDFSDLEKNKEENTEQLTLFG